MTVENSRLLKKLDTLSQTKTKQIMCNVSVERKVISNKSKITVAM